MSRQERRAAARNSRGYIPSISSPYTTASRWDDDDYEERGKSRMRRRQRGKDDFEKGYQRPRSGSRSGPRSTEEYPQGRQGTPKVAFDSVADRVCNKSRSARGQNSSPRYSDVQSPPRCCRGRSRSRGKSKKTPPGRSRSRPGGRPKKTPAGSNQYSSHRKPSTNSDRKTTPRKSRREILAERENAVKERISGSERLRNDYQARKDEEVARKEERPQEKSNGFASRGGRSVQPEDVVVGSVAQETHEVRNVPETTAAAQKGSITNNNVAHSSGAANGPIERNSKRENGQAPEPKARAKKTLPPPPPRQEPQLMQGIVNTFDKMLQNTRDKIRKQTDNKEKRIKMLQQAELKAKLQKMGEHCQQSLDVAGPSGTGPVDRQAPVVREGTPPEELFRRIDQMVQFERIAAMRGRENQRDAYGTHAAGLNFRNVKRPAVEIRTAIFEDQRTGTLRTVNVELEVEEMRSEQNENDPLVHLSKHSVSLQCGAETSDAWTQYDS